MHKNELAEQCVIASMMTGETEYEEILNTVSGDDFFDENHREFFNYLAGFVDQGRAYEITPITLINAYPQQTDYLKQVYSNSVSLSQGAAYARQVKESSRHRHVEEQLDGLLHQLKKNETDLPTVHRLLNNLVEEGIQYNPEVYVSQAPRLDQILTEGALRMEEIAERVAQGRDAGILTPFQQLNSLLGPLQGGQLISLAARPGLGKTAIANQICLHAAKMGYGVGCIHLEMSLTQIAFRTFAHQFQIPLHQIRSGHSKASEQVGLKFSEHFSSLAQMNMHVDVDSYSLNQVINRLTQWKRDHDIKLVMIDYLGLIEVRGASAYEQIRVISRAMKKIAKKLDIALIILCQLNRAMEKEKRRPMLSDLRDSGSIEQDIDMGLFLHSNPDQQVMDYKDVEIGVLKNRDGPVGWVNTMYTFNGPTQTFTEAGIRTVVNMSNEDKIKALNL